MEINQQIKNLLEIIQHVDDFDDVSNIEPITLGIIANDDFDILPSYVQDIIYGIDSSELNNLSAADFKEFANVLNAYLGQI